MIPQLLLVLLSIATLSLGDFAEARATEIPLGTTSEIRPSRFQWEVIAGDLPARDLLFDGTRALWILGKSSLWNWEFGDNRLRRVTLHKPTKDDPELLAMGSDGTGLYAASRRALYQIKFNPRRVFRFAIPASEKGTTLGLVGEGDEFFWVRTDAILRIDRYGKRLVPRTTKLDIKDRRPFVTSPQGDSLWYVDDDHMRRISIDNKGVVISRNILKTRHHFIDLQAGQNELIAHTPHTVLRLDQSGKIRQAIPVEGNRKLLRMHISRDTHAYLFDDQLLEIFETDTKSSRRHHLPLEDDEKPERLLLEESHVALLVDGKPRLFRLAKPD